MSELDNDVTLPYIAKVVNITFLEQQGSVWRPHTLTTNTKKNKYGYITSEYVKIWGPQRMKQGHKDIKKRCSGVSAYRRIKTDNQINTIRTIFTT